MWYNVNVSERDKLHYKPCPTKRHKNLVGKKILLKEVDTMTIREGFERAQALFVERGDVEMVAFFDKRLAQLDKKNSAERKPTAKQMENANFKADILAWMEPDEKYLSADVAKGVPSIIDAGVSAQRVSAMLTQLVNDGAIVRTEDKRKNYYSLA